MEKIGQMADSAPTSIEEQSEEREVPTQPLGRIGTDLASTFYKPPQSLTPPGLLGDAGYTSTHDMGF